MNPKNNVDVNVNKLLEIPPLSQSYYALRHGQSLANVAKIISSDPSISTVEHGLSDVGKGQATDAAELFVSMYCPKTYCGVAIFSSDFLRARETANFMAVALTKANIPLYRDEVVLDLRLRERYFGDWNGDSDEHYHDVWKYDADDATHTKFGVESVNSVIDRTTQLVLDVEDQLKKSKTAKPWKCMFVAHGDVLQIMQTVFQKVDGRVHRSLEHLGTATIRELKLAHSKGDKF